MRILIVDADRRATANLSAHLAQQRHVVDVARSSDDGLAYADTGMYDAVFFDTALTPDGAIAVCRTLRRAVPQTMIVVTAKDAPTEERVAALEAGADDVVAKPYALAELSARLRALARRFRGMTGPVLRSGRLTLDTDDGFVRYGDEVVPLSPTEHLVLALLIEHMPRSFTRDVLSERVLPFDRAGGADTIKAHVANLRRKIRAAGCPVDPIETVTGSGYRLRADL